MFVYNTGLLKKGNMIIMIIVYQRTTSVVVISLQNICKLIEQYFITVNFNECFFC